MEINGLFDIIFYSMNNKVSARIMAMEASFAKGRPMNIEAAASRLYLAIP